MRVRLREAMVAYRARTGQRMTYEKLSQASGVSVATLQSLAARPNYNTRISTIERVCIALQCTPGELLEITEDEHGRTS